MVEEEEGGDERATAAQQQENCEVPRSDSELRVDATVGERLLYPRTGEVLWSIEGSELSNKRHAAIAAMEELRNRAVLLNAHSTEPGYSLSLGVDGWSDMQRIYHDLFEEIPVAVGKALSKKERRESGREDATTLIYGEITFESFALALEKIRTKYGKPGVGSSGKDGVLQSPGGLFCDIGSGTGKPCIAAALYWDFSKVLGIEVLEGLYGCSLRVKRSWDEKYRAEAKRSTEVEFVLGDALDFGVRDWSNADVVFANSTCFDDELMSRLADQCGFLKPGSFVITFTKSLPSKEFQLLEQEMHLMSWGGEFSTPYDFYSRRWCYFLAAIDRLTLAMLILGATVFIQQRSDPGQET